MSRRLRVFLCHASQDKPAVRQLFERLSSQPWVQPWLDEKSLLPGQDWRQVIEEAVDTTDVVIVCLSNQSVPKEGFIQREIRYAYETALEKPEGTIFIIPLRLDDCEVPRSLRKFHYEDYFGSRKEASYDHLLQALKVRFEQVSSSDSEASQSPVSEITTPQLSPTTILTRPKALWFGSVSLVLLVGIVAARNLFNANPPISEPPSVTQTVSPLKVSTFAATKTLTPKPPTITPSPTPWIGSTMMGKDGMLLVFVPAGEFTMGNEDGEPDERPEHEVYLDAFWIDQTEVTNAMYAECVADDICKPPLKTKSNTRPEYFGKPEFDEYPVNYISWSMAKIYCQWAGRDLPTEAQWEKAARGTDGRIYPWGNSQIRAAFLNYQDGGLRDTTQVRSYPDGVSPYGAYDMAGNVYEWVDDWYSATYYQNSPPSNPQGPEAGQFHIVRGGAWGFPEQYVRSTYRNFFDDNKEYNFGFRCALTP